MKGCGQAVMLIVVGVFVLVGLAMCSQGGGSAPSPQEQAERRCDRFAGYHYGTRLVEQRLRAPATAEFQSFNALQDGQLVRLGDCRWRLTAYVDSQNGFSAMVRTRFTVIAASSDQGRSWTAESLTLEE